MKKIMGISLLIALLIILAACSENDAEADDSNEHVSITYNMVNEPEPWVPIASCGADTSEVIYAAYEGLIKEAPGGEIVPGVAEEWTVSEDGKTWTFNLREDAKWSDGEQVTAHDFEFSMMWALTPGLDSCAVGNFSEIENAMAFNQGEVEFDEVGIKAIDEFTLEITTSSVVPHFEDILIHQAYSPVREDLVDGNLELNWIFEEENWVSNGPFKVVDYNTEDRFVFEKNEHYWDKDNIQVDELIFRMVGDSTTSHAAFQTGELDVIKTLPTAVLEEKIESGEAQVLPSVRTYWFNLNVGESASDNVKDHFWDEKVREALRLGIDRTLLTENVLRNGETPADGYIPEIVLDADGVTSWVDNRDPYFPVEGDIERAQELLVEAGYPNGEGLPTITMLTNNIDREENLAIAIQDMWQQNLGVNIDIEVRETQVFATARENGEFELTRGGLSGINDPSGLLEAFKCGESLNMAQYCDEEYDELFERAQAELDPEARFAMLHELEDMLIENHVIIPLTYMNIVMLAQDGIEGVYTTGRGAFKFDHAYVN